MATKSPRTELKADGEGLADIGVVMSELPQPTRDFITWYADSKKLSPESVIIEACNSFVQGVIDDFTPDETRNLLAAYFDIKHRHERFTRVPEKAFDFAVGKRA